MNTELKVTRHLIDHLLYSKNYRLQYWFFNQLGEVSMESFDADGLAFWGFIHHPVSPIWHIPNAETDVFLASMLIEAAAKEGSHYGILLQALGFDMMYPQDELHRIDVSEALPYVQAKGSEGNPFALTLQGLWEQRQGGTGEESFVKAAYYGGPMFQRGAFIVANGADLDMKELEEGNNLDKITSLGWAEIESKAKDGIGLYAYLMGKRHELAGEYKEAVTWYELGAKGAYPLALRALGDFYYINYYVEGAVPNDHEKGLRYYERAAELGDRYSCAQAAYGYVARFGDIPQDWGRAIYWIKELGPMDENGDGLPYIGYALAHGKGVERDEEEAYDWLMEAKAEENRRAKAGDFQYPPRIRALWRNGLGYLNELGVVKRRSLKQAYNYYEESAKIYEDIRERWPGLDMSDDEGKERLSQFVVGKSGRLGYPKGVKVTTSVGNGGERTRSDKTVVLVSEKGWGDDAYAPMHGTSNWGPEEMKTELKDTGRLVMRCIGGDFFFGEDPSMFALVQEVEIARQDDGSYGVKLRTAEEELDVNEGMDFLDLMDFSFPVLMGTRTTTMSYDTVCDWIDIYFQDVSACGHSAYGWKSDFESPDSMPIFSKSNPLWIIKFKDYYEGVFAEDLGRLLVDEYLNRLGNGEEEPLLIMSPTEEKPSIRIEDLSGEGQSPNYHLLLAYVTKQGILDYEAMSPHIDLVKAEALSIMQGEPAGKYLEIHERLEETPPLH